MFSPHKTVGELLEATCALFETCGIDSPRLDAEVLLSHVLNTDRLYLYREPDQRLTDQQIAHFYDLVNRRMQREPVAYIIGEKEFWSLSLIVDPSVLIPRPETELLVETALTCIKPLDRQGCCTRILDLGTGSGAIAIALAKETVHAVIIATDNSLAALRVAQKNVVRHRCAQRVHLVCGDWVQPCREKPVFHMIVANPPYIPSPEIETLPPEIKDYEPQAALDGGADGLGFYRAWIPIVQRLLLPGGWIAVEIASPHAEFVRSCMHNVGMSQCCILVDLSGQQRVVLAQKT